MKFLRSLFNRSRSAESVMTVMPDGTRKWLISAGRSSIDYRGSHHGEGLLHRDGGPALERADGSREWWRNGQPHRDDGPAIEHANGTKEWWRNGLLHRDHGPAIERFDASKEWYRHGLLHRDDGPAVEWSNGGKEWFRNGRTLTAKEIAVIQQRMEKRKHAVKAGFDVAASAMPGVSAGADRKANECKPTQYP